ncbi:hypothetical protein MAJ_11108, partial [Metarhizium majus ARSEF 297]
MAVGIASVLKKLKEFKASASLKFDKDGCPSAPDVFSYPVEEVRMFKASMVRGLDLDRFPWRGVMLTAEGAERLVLRKDMIRIEQKAEGDGRSGDDGDCGVPMPMEARWDLVQLMEHASWVAYSLGMTLAEGCIGRAVRLEPEDSAGAASNVEETGNTEVTREALGTIYGGLVVRNMGVRCFLGDTGRAALYFLQKSFPWVRYVDENNNMEALPPVWREIKSSRVKCQAFAAWVDLQTVWLIYYILGGDEAVAPVKRIMEEVEDDLCKVMSDGRAEQFSVRKTLLDRLPEVRLCVPVKAVK